MPDLTRDIEVLYQDKTREEIYRMMILDALELRFIREDDDSGDYHDDYLEEWDLVKYDKDFVQL